MPMLRRRYVEMDDDELGEAITEAQRLSASSGAASSRLGELAAEAAKRLTHPAAARRAARLAYAREAAMRALTVVWWVHLAVLVLLAFAAADEVMIYKQHQAERLTAVATLGGGWVVIRLVLTGRWQFGPPG